MPRLLALLLLLGCPSTGDDDDATANDDDATADDDDATADDDAAEDRHCVEAGAVGVIHKPFKPTRLADQVEALVAAGR